MRAHTTHPKPKQKESGHVFDNGQLNGTTWKHTICKLKQYIDLYRYSHLTLVACSCRLWTCVWFAFSCLRVYPDKNYCVWPLNELASIGRLERNQLHSVRNYEYTRIMASSILRTPQCIFAYSSSALLSHEYTRVCFCVNVFL